MSDVKTPTVENPTSSPLPELAGKTVLVVDDSKTFRTSAVGFLKKFGVGRILTAEDGDEGFKLLQQNSDIALVVTDIDMPKKDGLKLLEDIRYYKHRNGYSAHQDDVPVIVTTAESNEDRRFKALQLDAVFISKPYKEAELKASVPEAFELAKDLRARNEALSHPDATRPGLSKVDLSLKHQS